MVICSMVAVTLQMVKAEVSASVDVPIKMVVIFSVKEWFNAANVAVGVGTTLDARSPMHQKRKSSTQLVVI